MSTAFADTVDRVEPVTDSQSGPGDHRNAQVEWAMNNEQHLRVMLHDLQDFTDGGLSLGELISGLEARGRALVPPEAEDSELWQQWFALEQVYADALDRSPGVFTISSQEREVVERAASRLEEWLLAQLAGAQR